jgi:hypothetical protein
MDYHLPLMADLLPSSFFIINIRFFEIARQTAPFSLCNLNLPN